MRLKRQIPYQRDLRELANFFLFLGMLENQKTMFFKFRYRDKLCSRRAAGMKTPFYDGYLQNRHDHIERPKAFNSF